MLPGETLAGVVERYEQVAPEASRSSPPSPIRRPTRCPMRPGTSPEQCAAREVLVHVIAETAQHIGHADILREAIDGHTST
jgi:hypothetical protein